MISDHVRIAVMGAGSFVASAALVPIARRVAVKNGITDDPNFRKFHQTPTPYLGGVAIFLVTVAIAAFAPGWRAEAGVLLGGAVLVGVIGLVDDVRTVKPWIRVVVEVAAASAAYVAGARVELASAPVNFLLTVLTLVVLTNSFNLLDNMDGALGSVGATIALCLTAAALLNGQVLVGALSAAVAGACLGFLVHNWPPARIFMGDAGSLFLGYLLAAIALKIRTGLPHDASLIAVGLLVAPALFDTMLVVIARVRARRPIYQGGTDHTSHRLVSLGLTPPTAAVAMVLATAVTAGLGVGVADGLVGAWPSAMVVVPGAIAGLVLLLRVPAYET